MGRRCFAWHSSYDREAGGGLVGRRHERVRSRMTVRSVVRAAAGDPRHDSHLDTDIDVRVTTVAIASRAQ